MMERFEVVANFDWESTARDCGISHKEMELFSQRFKEGY
jgi:hypothetical protein